MAAEEFTCSLNGNSQRRPLSTGVIKGSCKIGGYTTFEEEELLTDQTKTKNRKKLIVLSFCASNVFAGIFYSLPAPFFAIEAKKKGTSVTVAGLILAIYQLVCMLVTLPIGNYLTTLGPKLTFVIGLMICGGSIICFGYLDVVPSGATYIVLCLVSRCVQACGSSAFCTASLAIVANEFPNKVSTVYSILELATGFGMTIGPALGELLYKTGGFRLPFVSCGAALLAVGGLAWLMLPPQTEILQKRSKSFWSFGTKLPVLLVGFVFIVLFGSFGFCEIALAIHIKTNYHVSPALFAAVFFTNGGFYAFSSPVFGFVDDRKPQWAPALVIAGSLICSAALIFMGPATFLHIPNHPLWLLYVSQALLGIGVGSSVVCAQQLFTIATKYGYPDNLDTYGMVSGVFLFFGATGLFLGPIIGGWLSDTIGFEWAAAVIGFTGFIALSLWVVYIATSRCRADRTDENLPILSNLTE